LLVLDLLRLEFENFKQVDAAIDVAKIGRLYGDGTIFDGGYFILKPLREKSFGSQRCLDLVKCRQGDAAIVSNSLLLLRGGYFDFGPEGTAMIDWDSHAKRAVEQPRIETQHRQQLIAEAAAFDGELELRK